MAQITQEEALRLLRQRVSAQTSLAAFARYVQIPGVPQSADANDDVFQVIETPLAQHHLLILQTLQALVDEELRYSPDLTGVMKGQQGFEGAAICRRVMLMFPPGSAKSTYASVVFPAWYMGREPGTEIILTGWGDPICKRNGKRARQLVASPSYKSVFGVGLNPDTKAADDWETSKGSSYKSKGITSGITGFRCNGLIWDDITKGRKEADSFNIRQDTWNAYIDDARSRKTPKAWEVGIGTRWHEDDPMGRILPDGYAGESGFMACRDGNVWFVLCCAAKAERTDDPLGRAVGEFIWPEWFGEDYWQDKMVNPRSWASLYQQRPAPDEGLFFKQEWFRRYDTLPDCDFYIAYDPALRGDEDGDETALQVWGIDSQSRLFLVDEWVQHATMDVWIDKLLDWVLLYKPLKVISESGQIRRASEPFLKRAMTKRRVYATFEWVTRTADKSTMARAAQAMYAAHQIYHPNTSVGDDMEDELKRFPTSSKDHRVDAVANLCLHLEGLWEKASYEPESTKTLAEALNEPMKVSKLMPPRFKKKVSRWQIRD